MSGKEASEKGYDLEFVSSKEPIDEPGTFLLAEEHYVLVVNNKHKLLLPLVFLLEIFKEKLLLFRQ